jgi:hypothetical protein
MNLLNYSYTRSSSYTLIILGSLDSLLLDLLLLLLFNLVLVNTLVILSIVNRLLSYYSSYN